MYIVHFDAIASALTLINLYIFYGQKKVDDSLSSRFEVVLWVTLGSSIFSAASSWAINRPDLFNEGSRIATTLAFYVFHNALPFAIAQYVIAVTGKKFRSKRSVALLVAPFALAECVILANPVTGFVFFFDADRQYHRGPGLLFLYVLAFSYFVYLAGLFAARRKLLPPLTRLVFPIVLAIPFVAVGLENLFSAGRVLLECFASAVSMLLVLYTIQNSGELVDGATGLLNRSAFVKYVGPLFRDGMDFDVLLFSVRDLPLMRQVFDIRDLLRLSQGISRFFSQQARTRGAAFSLGDDTYALIFHGAVGESETRLSISAIAKRFERPWPVGGTETDISLQPCRIRCPKDAKGIIEIFDCLERLTSLEVPPERFRVLRPEDLNLVGSAREAEAERALRIAIGTGRIELLFQPVYSVAAGRFVLAEAMLTLRTAEGKRIPQAELIRVAERSAFAQRLGLMIIDTVCAFHSAHAQEAGWVDQILVRLSGAQCMQSDLAEQTLAVIEAWRIDPRRLCFQITETAAVHSPAVMSRNMTTLAEKKLAFALDDYGSGYTDLGYIVELPFSLIKLDAGIVRAGFQSKKGRIIMDSTIELIKRLNRRIVAEGVEAAEQAEILATLGCDYLQGPYFSEAVSGEELVAVVGGPFL